MTGAPCRTIRIQIERNHWDLETCRKSQKKLFLVFITHKGQRFSEVALAAFSIIKQDYSTLGKNILELFEKGIQVQKMYPPIALNTYLHPVREEEYFFM